MLQVRDEEEFLAIDSPDCMARWGGRLVGVADWKTSHPGVLVQRSLQGP